MNFDHALAFWIVTRIVAPACVLLAVLTIADAILEWWRGEQ